jgi:thiamine biosynthesis lipoprotein
MPSIAPRWRFFDPWRGEVTAPAWSGGEASQIKTEVLMGTTVTIQVVDAAAADETIDRAFDWFRRVEACCSRFDPDSELMQLSSHVGVPMPVSTMLFEAVQFAVAVAEETGGAFDPTVGHDMESRGFNREYSTGRVVHTNLDSAGPVSYRDVQLDLQRRTITLLRPLVLDLGAVAKGLAVDTAARELRPFRNFAIDAGGDLYLGGCTSDGEAWTVGIRHPRLHDQLIEKLHVSDKAVCTSGDYERRSDDARGHILDPRTGQPADEVASVTVVAPTAMLADAMATAAFVLGLDEGIDLFDRVGVDGLIVSPTMERRETRGLKVA